MRDGGKGDAPRPLSISIEEFDNAWDKIFKKANVELKQAFFDSTQENAALYHELSVHEKECGK
jgi:hypothetical protein